MGNFDPDQFWSKKKRMLEEPVRMRPLPEESSSPRVPDYKERGGCLTTYLVLITIGSVVGLCLNLVSGSVSIFILAASVVDLVAIAGLWYWQRWAFYTLAAGYGLGVLLSCTYSDGTLVVGSMIGVVLRLVTLLVVFKDKSELLE